ncbi:MAG: hypothetical protein JO115_02270 [Pseudonocardiales bacterium]|nr:hypothetical protein [Pseudonocardiales bacterium]
MSATEREGTQPARSYRWRDGDGTPLHLLCRVEQIAIDPPKGAMAFRLHQQGQVVGWDASWLHACFDDRRALVLLHAHLVGALDPPWGSR